MKAAGLCRSGYPHWTQVHYEANRRFLFEKAGLDPDDRRDLNLGRGWRIHLKSKLKISEYILHSLLHVYPQDRQPLWDRHVERTNRRRQSCLAARREKHRIAQERKRIAAGLPPREAKIKRPVGRPRSREAWTLEIPDA